jgi:hypothetical protein
MNELIKLIVKLIESKEANRRNFFDDFVEPLFLEVESMTDKYKKLFESESNDDLNKIRNEYIQSREKITALIEVYRKHEDPLVSEFLESVHDLFFSVEAGSKYQSIGKSYIEIMISPHLNLDTKTKIREELSNEHLKKWNNVVKGYGEIKFKYKQPIKI